MSFYGSESCPGKTVIMKIVTAEGDGGFGTERRSIRQHKWYYSPYVTGILRWRRMNDYWACYECGAQTDESPDPNKSLKG